MLAKWRITRSNGYVRITPVLAASPPAKNRFMKSELLNDLRVYMGSIIGDDYLLVELKTPKLGCRKRDLFYQMSKVSFEKTKGTFKLPNFL